MIDPSKVNLSEADIEEYLWRNPGVVEFDDGFGHKGRIKRWLKRQYQVPSGILDLFGETAGKTLVVVEVKNVEVDSRAVAQVCRYAFDMSEIMRRVGGRRVFFVDKVLVGPSISRTAFLECEACDVNYIEFSVNLRLSTFQRNWNQRQAETRTATWDRLADDDDLQSVFVDYGPDPACENNAAEKSISDAVDEFLESTQDTDE